MPEMSWPGILVARLYGSGQVISSPVIPAAWTLIRISASLGTGLVISLFVATVGEDGSPRIWTAFIVMGIVLTFPWEV